MNDADRVKIIESGLGNVTVSDLEIQEQINSEKDDECIIYMFNVDLSNSATRYYQKLMYSIWCSHCAFKKNSEWKDI